MEASQNNKAVELVVNLSQMHFARQLMLMVGIAGSIALGVAAVLWSQSPEYRLLYSGLSVNDRVDITTSLEQNGLEYRIDNRTGEITVPAADIHKTRLALARTGLPPKVNKGFSILDQKQTLGTSNFIERARFNRALQEELVETIESMESIREARVHLSVPKQNSFLRSQQQPSASVMVNLYPGSTLGEMQISGIRHLVAASTVGLDGEHVSVIDQKGNLLSTDPDSQFAMSSAHLRLQRQVEQEYADRIVRILSPIVGSNRVHAQVSADLDLTFVETTQENFDPATVVRSEQVQQEDTNQESAAVGVPGGQAGAPAGGGAAGNLGGEAQNLRSKSSSTRNFEIDRTISHTRKKAGGITRMSVAVLVDYPDSPKAAVAEAGGEGEQAEPGAGAEPEVAAAVGAGQEQMSDEQRDARLLDLVKQTIGYDESRGDKVSIVSSDFLVETVTPIEEEINWLEEPLLWSALRQVGAATVVLFLIFGVLRPVLKSSVTLGNSLPQRKQARLPNDAAAQGEAGMGLALSGEDQVSLSAPPAVGHRAQGGAAQLVQYEQNLAQAKAIVAKEPAQAARLIQGWVVDE